MIFHETLRFGVFRSCSKTVAYNMSLRLLSRLFCFRNVKLCAWETFWEAWSCELLIVKVVCIFLIHKKRSCVRSMSDDVTILINIANDVTILVHHEWVSVTKVRQGFRRYEKQFTIWYLLEWNCFLETGNVFRKSWGLRDRSGRPYCWERFVCLFRM